MKQIGINEATFKLPLDEFKKVHKAIANDVDLVGIWTKKNVTQFEETASITSTDKAVTDGKDNAAGTAKKTGKTGRRVGDTGSDREHGSDNAGDATSTDAAGETV